jgi:mannitol-specific phosphotransferase system IIBC component
MKKEESELMLSAKVNRQREISQVNGRHIANNKNTHRWIKQCKQSIDRSMGSNSAGKTKIRERNGKLGRREKTVKYLYVIESMPTMFPVVSTCSIQIYEKVAKRQSVERKIANADVKQRLRRHSM